jgi:dTDP-L-rhamnose 4-epimerase
MPAPRGIVLVTGGAGFIGSHIVDALIEAGYGVRILDSLHRLAHSRVPDYLNRRAEYVFAELQDLDALDRCLEGVTAVSHQASMVGLGTDFADVEDYVRHNDAGTAALLRALFRKSFTGRLVLGSSMVVYGEGRYVCVEHGPVRPSPRSTAALAKGLFDPLCPNCGHPVRPEPVPEDAPADPRSIYAATKLHQEHLASAFGRATGSQVTSLRYHNVYGPRMPRDTPYAGVASLFRSALAGGRAPMVYEDGRQIRDFVHVRDVARANLLALTSEPPCLGAYNVASGEPHTIGEMATALAGAFGDGIAPKVTGKYRIGDVRHVFASTRLAEERMGFRAQVPFFEGMREFAGAPLREPAETNR